MELSFVEECLIDVSFNAAFAFCSLMSGNKLEMSSMLFFASVVTNTIFCTETESTNGTGSVFSTLALIALTSGSGTSFEATASSISSLDAVSAATSLSTMATSSLPSSFSLEGGLVSESDSVTPSPSKLRSIEGASSALVISFVLSVLSSEEGLISFLSTETESTNGTGSVFSTLALIALTSGSGTSFEATASSISSLDAVSAATSLSTMATSSLPSSFSLEGGLVSESDSVTPSPSKLRSIEGASSALVISFVLSVLSSEEGLRVGNTGDCPISLFSSCTVS